MYISDVFGQKSVNLQVFFPIFPYFKVLINIHEYSNKKICISDFVIKDLCRLKSSRVMVVFVGTPPFRRIALWVAMETMHLDIARIKKNLGTNFGDMTGFPMNNPTPIETCSVVAS